MGIGAAIGSVAGGLIGAGGAESAAQTQANAANQAAQISQNEFNTITQQEQPFMQGGYSALSSLENGLGIGTANPNAGTAFGSLLQPFTAQNWQQLSPAYNFQLQQGQQGVLNGDSSSVGALSGGAQKDLMNFNQGLANTSFNNAFNMYQTQTGNIYNRLAGLVSSGQNAAANTGQQGTTLAGLTGQNITNAGSALAAGTVGATNALGSGLTNGATLAALLGGSSGGGVNAWNNGASFVNPNGSLNYDPGAGVPLLGGSG